MSDNSPGSTPPHVTHALRNHLAVIVGFCELLIDETPPEDPRRPDLLEIRKAAVAALELLDRVREP